MKIAISFFILFVMGYAFEYPYEQNSTKEAIIERCENEMGSMGHAVVKVCVDEDLKAIKALSRYYTKEDEPIIRRCKQHMQHLGYAVVQVCVDEDIRARNTLKNY